MPGGIKKKETGYEIPQTGSRCVTTRLMIQTHSPSAKQKGQVSATSINYSLHSNLIASYCQSFVLSAQIVFLSAQNLGASAYIHNGYKDLIFTTL